MTPAGGRLVRAELPPVKQAMTRSSRAELAGELEQAHGCRDAALVGKRVGGLEHLDPLQHGRGAPGPDDDGAAVEAVAEDPLEGDGDLQARLAGAEDDDAPTGAELMADPVDDELVALEGDEPVDREAGIAGDEPGLGDPQGQLAGAAEAVGEELFPIDDRRRAQRARRDGRRDPGPVRLPFA